MQYTPGNPFQGGQWEDQRYAGRMMLNYIYRGQKCQIGRPLSMIEEDGRTWFRRPKLRTKSCRAVLRREEDKLNSLKYENFRHSVVLGYVSWQMLTNVPTDCSALIVRLKGSCKSRPWKWRHYDSSPVCNCRAGHRAQYPAVHVSVATGSEDLQSAHRNVLCT